MNTPRDLNQNQLLAALLPDVLLSPIQPERRATQCSASKISLADHSFVFADYSFFDT